MILAYPENAGYELALVACMSYYHRSLPHWHPDGARLFLTWRLFGSLPPPVPDSCPTRPGHAFVSMDRRLDRADFGPQWLRDGRIARCTVDAFHFGQIELTFYELYAYVIMPNHVHILLRAGRAGCPNYEEHQRLHRARSQPDSGTTGHPFWLYESYDHWVRNETECRGSCVHRA